MKKLLLFLTIALMAGFAFGQTKTKAKVPAKMSSMVCCPNTATQQFAMLAADKKFVMSHGTPKKFHFQSSIAKAVTYKTPDGKESTAWEWKAAKPTNNYLLVIHEYWGLNDWIKKISEQLYTDLGNVHVIALDLYDRKEAT